jgi:hypothetical protein
MFRETAQYREGVQLRFADWGYYSDAQNFITIKCSINLGTSIPYEMVYYLRHRDISIAPSMNVTLKCGTYKYKYLWSA